jgi:hypothetical protein
MRKYICDWFSRLLTIFSNWNAAPWHSGLWWSQLVFQLVFLLVSGIFYSGRVGLAPFVVVCFVNAQYRLYYVYSHGDRHKAIARFIFIIKLKSNEHCIYNLQRTLCCYKIVDTASCSALSGRSWNIFFPSHRSHLELKECPCLKYHDITTSHNIQLVAVFKSSLSQKKVTI